ncbi:MAG: Cytochrome oxidase assembly protein [Acidobacteria bacterium]|nr:Cytochrome oxidase assembly protein [Acidobacteriota bacterium]
MTGSASAPRRDPGAVLALGFGTTVAMWAAGYFLRLPWIQAPSALVALVMLGLLAGGGFLAGRFAGGWRTGALAGLLTMALNMLILGSLLTSADAPNQFRPGAAIWLPGALLAGAAIGALAALAGSSGRGPDRPSPNWIGVFAGVAAAATLGLVTIGGLVTSNDAGLAVVDWPNSFGYNMFLYPLSRMTGGIYYEHAHRLFGSLVGLTTLVLAIVLWRTEERGWVKRLALLAFVLVVVQGILGGLRVTGRFTLSADPAHTAPSLALAVVHGVTGQLFFALMVALAVVTTRRFRDPAPPEAVPAAATERGLSSLLVGTLIVQLVLGAVLRHTGTGLLVHISMATLVAGLAVAAGVRAWGLYGRIGTMRRAGQTLLALVAVQLTLGVGALAAVTMRRPETAAPLWEAIVTTSHQVTGALLLASGVALAIWCRRLILPAAAPLRSGVAEPA